MTAVVLLAAGASRRLGSSKPDFLYHGKRLLDYALEAILPLDLATFVIEGAHPITGDLGHARLLHNPNWDEGMAASIRCGVAALPDKVEQVLVCVCDQPHLTTSLLQTMLDTQVQTGRPIVAATYSGTLGVPVLLSRRFFPDLLKLQGDIGAKRVVVAHLDQVAKVEFPLGELDIDEVPV